MHLNTYFFRTFVKKMSMKKSLVVLSIILLSVSSIAQQITLNQLTGVENKNAVPVRNVNAIVQVLDSTIDYVYNSGWEFTEKEITTVRHWESGFPYEKIAYFYDAGVWNEFIKYHLEWYDSVMYKMYTVLPWNSFLLDWGNDTIMHYCFTNYESTQLGMMYNDISFMMAYDFNTNQLTGGGKIIPVMYNDTLYEKYYVYDYNDASGIWEPGAKYQFTYTTEGLVQTLLHQDYNSATSLYENVDHKFFAYSGTDKLIEVNQNWITDHWENDSKIEYTYNASNQNEYKISYTWDNVNDEWDIVDRHVYTYSGNDLTIDAYQVYNGSSYNNSYRLVYTYDGNGNVLTRRQDLYPGSWEYNSLLEYTYNSNNDRLTLKSSNWIGGAWVNSYLYTYTYNSNFDLTEQLYQTWSGSAWVNVDKYENTYDAYYNRTEHVFSTWSGSAWEYDNKTEYYWSQYDANGISELFNSSMNVFPNPSSGLINIDQVDDHFNMLSVYDESGKIVMTKEINGHHEMINLKQFGTGIFIITLSNEFGESESRKLMVY